MKNSSDCRPLPNLQEAGDYYWQSGKTGEFTLGWCSGCQHWLHPAREICPDCTTPPSPKTASGQARLITYTINHQPWIKGLETPYIIAIVAPVEAPDIQLTTNLVDVSHEQLLIGMALQSDWRCCKDVWLPVFKPRNNPVKKSETRAPAIIRFSSTSEKYENASAFTGAGKSSIARKLPQSPLMLTAEACINAIADSGLNRADIDGLCAYPGTSGMPGLSSGGVREIAYALNLQTNWHTGAQELPGQAGTIPSAMLAIASGLCNHVLCFTSFSASNRPLPNDLLESVVGEPRWSLPYGCVSPANWIGMYANRYLHQYGASETLLGTLAIAQRQNAELNPEALYRNPLNMENYLGSRKISTPFKLLDCDTPCDGAIAFVISKAERARDLPKKPVYIEACGTAFAETQSWDQGTVVYQPNVLSASQHLWSRTDLSPKDIDLAELYDGFTFNTICWLEALGFCDPGGATDFIGDGSRILINGQLPINTHGGHLNAGRSNGYGHIYEAITQLRGEAGVRQVNDAKIAAVSTGGGIPASAMLLKTEP
ncbi:MAG: OB-fold domain-containing protein [Pseudomonadales bacterium]|nr:OB-fold domain-containing protein [Pseudomonadales bacterium]MCP5172159.1 OB-fold domain-containing protein [Pseudomonadales bacterium]